MNETLKSMLAHRSVRAYTDQAVDDGLLEHIISAVQAAPNWVNTQHVSIIAIKDTARKAEFAALCGNQPYIAQAPVFLIFCADFYRTYLACTAHGQAFDGVMSRIDNLIVGANEVGIALGTAVAAAESLGLGSVPIGDARLNALAITEKLDLPPYVLPMVGLCLGYPAENHEIKPRLPQAAVYFEERYNRNLNGLIQEYDSQYADYLQRRPWNNRVGNWSQLVADFYRSDYNHYPEIPTLLAKQGFGLE